MLLIQGSGPERRSTIDTALSFDVDWMRGQSVGIFPIEFSGPRSPIVAELEKILDSGEAASSQGDIKFQVMARLNGIMVVSRRPDMLRAAETWIKRLDSTDTNRTSVHVYRVNYGEAKQVAKVLTDIFGGGSGLVRHAPRRRRRARRPSACRRAAADRPASAASAAAAAASQRPIQRPQRQLGGFLSTIGVSNGNTGADSPQRRNGEPRRRQRHGRPGSGNGPGAARTCGSPPTPPTIRC